MSRPDLGAEELLRPAEVAALFGVDAKSVTRWTHEGRLTSVKTLGGHHRYRALEVEALLRAGSQNRGEGRRKRHLEDVT